MKRFAMLLASLGMAASLLAGCGSAPSAPAPATPAPAPAAPEKVEITFMSWEGAEMQKAMLTAIKEGFEAKHPNITVKVVPNPLQDYGQKINSLFAAGELPDVFQSGNDWARQWGSQGKLLAISDDLLQGGTHFSLDKVFPGVIPNWQVGGKLYGLPGLLNTWGIFYNKKLFQAAGLTLPKAGWTYDEFFKDMQALTKGKDFGYVDSGSFRGAYTIGQYAVSAGTAGFMDSIMSPTKVTASGAFLDGVHKWQNAIKQGWSSPPGYDASHVVDEFMAGKIPMFSYGQWAADQLIRNAPADLDWDFVPLPIVKDQVSLYDCVGWSTPANTKHPKEAAELLKFVSSDLYKTVLVQFPVAPPAYEPVSGPYYDVIKSKGHQGMVDALGYMLQAKTKTPTRFSNTWAGDVNKLYDVTWDKLMQGQGGDEAVQKLVSDIQAVVDKNKGKE